MELTGKSIAALRWVGCDATTVEEGLQWIDKAFKRPSINYYPEESTTIYLDIYGDIVECDQKDFDDEESMLNEFIIKCCNYLGDTASKMWDNDHYEVEYSPVTGPNYTVYECDGVDNAVAAYYGGF